MCANLENKSLYTLNNTKLLPGGRVPVLFKVQLISGNTIQ